MREARYSQAHLNAVDPREEVIFIPVWVAFRKSSMLVVCWHQFLPVDSKGMTDPYIRDVWMN